MGRRHGGRGHRVSPRVVRQRRRAGIRPNRGHNFDARLRNDRTERLAARDVKGFEAIGEATPRTIDVQTAAVVADLAANGGALREDLEQELWIMFIEGATVAEVRAALPSIRSRLADVEWGGFGDLRLDAPLRNAPQRHGDPPANLIDLIDDTGHFPGMPWLDRLARSGWQKHPCAECSALAWGRICMKCRLSIGFYTDASIRAKALELASGGASIRRIAAETGLARNTVTRIVGPRPRRATQRQPSAHKKCERCGYSASYHSPWMARNKRRAEAVCERAVIRCPRCGWWRSTYSQAMCRVCRRDVPRSPARKLAA